MHDKSLSVAFLLALASCAQGPVGPEGPAGPQGPAGSSTPGNLDVIAFGAQQDEPSFDNTPSFQSAIDAAADAGGGTVSVPVGRFWFSGSISIRGNVSLAGMGTGPYDPYTDPSVTTMAPTLLPTSSTGAAFITLDGDSALQNVLIHYPNQLQPNAPGVETAGPNIYPPTVLVVDRGKVFGCTFDNSYIAIQVLAGRTYLENLQIGAFKNDIVIDRAQDFVHISHITSSVFWDLGSLLFPQPIDTWVANNSVALTSYRMDALSIEDFDVYWRNTGIAFLDSPDGYGATYGNASNLDLEVIQYGVIAKSLNQIVAFQFTNLSVGLDPAFAGVAIWLPAGGAQTPRVVVEGGVAWGFGPQPLKVEAGLLRVQDMVNLNPIGRLPALGLAVPALPASGVAYVSSLPADAQVVVSGGSVQDVLIGGQSTGLTSGTFAVAPGQSIAVSYTSAPEWEWLLD